MTEDAQQTVAEWVNGGVIADLLAESLIERGMRVTVKSMKGLWLAAARATLKPNRLRLG